MKYLPFDTLCFLSTPFLGTDGTRMKLWIKDDHLYLIPVGNIFEFSMSIIVQSRPPTYIN